MVLQFSVLSEHLIDIMMQVTECKNTPPVLRYDLKSDGVPFVPTCPVFAGPVTYNKLHHIIHISGLSIQVVTNTGCTVSRLLHSVRPCCERLLEVYTPIQQ